MRLRESRDQVSPKRFILQQLLLCVESQTISLDIWLMGKGGFFNETLSDENQNLWIDYEKSDTFQDLKIIEIDV